MLNSQLSDRLAILIMAIVWDYEVKKIFLWMVAQKSFKNHSKFIRPFFKKHHKQP